MTAPRLLLSIVFIIAATHVNAVPAQAVSQTVKLGNGSVAVLTLMGDEHGHGWFSSDGCLAEPQADGTWLLLSPTATAQRGQTWQSFRQQHDMQRASHRVSAFAQNYLRGTKRVLVLLVEFSNKQFSTDTARKDFDDFFNLKNYNRFGSIGSFADYFYDQSYGQLQFVCDVVGPVTLSHDYAYYGSNVGIDGSDMYPGQMVAEACMAVDDVVDFSRYDWDDDGEVEQVLVIYAGHGESGGAPSNTIWPHQYSLDQCALSGDGSGSVRLDNTVVNTYACVCELDGSSGEYRSGIGTACHEFGHCLGLPDFYDVSKMGSPGMGAWDIMSSGSYSGPKGRGEVPCGYTAYERWWFGWLNLTEVTNSTTVTDMPCLDSEPCAYLVRNSAAHNEWIVIENRQPQRWFTYASTTTGCHGLLLTHVDLDDQAWQNNRVNNNIHHQRMSFIPADTSFGVKSNGQYYADDAELRGDLFPGSNKVVALTHASHTNVGGRWFTPTAMYSTQLEYELVNIKENNGRLSFSILEDNRSQDPIHITVTEITSNSFTATWDDVPSIDSYEAELSWVVSIKPYSKMTEKISGITTNSYTFTDVPTPKLSLRIRTVSAGINSEWSQPVTVHLTPVGVHDNEDDYHKSQTKWYTISGQSVRQPRHRGIYIISTDRKSKQTLIIP